MQSAGTRLCTTVALDFVCQSRKSLILCSGYFYPINGVLIMFPIAVVVHLPGNREVITGCFFIWILPERVERCEEDGLSSILALFSSWNESVLQDGLDAERTTLVQHKLFPFARNHNVPNQFRCHCCSTRVSLNFSKISQGFFGILAILEPRLAAPFMDVSKSICF